MLVRVAVGKTWAAWPDKTDVQERWEEAGAEYALPRSGMSPEVAAKVKRFLPFSAGTRDCVRSRSTLIGGHMP